MSEMSYIQCPRCEGVIENRDGLVFQAMSRATPERDIAICAPCGADEALRMHDADGWVVPVAEWPMRNTGEVRFGPMDPHYFHDELMLQLPMSGSY